MENCDGASASEGNEAQQCEIWCRVRLTLEIEPRVEDTSAAEDAAACTDDVGGGLTSADVY